MCVTHRPAVWCRHPACRYRCRRWTARQGGAAAARVRAVSEGCEEAGARRPQRAGRARVAQSHSHRRCV